MPYSDTIFARLDIELSHIVTAPLQESVHPVKRKGEVPMSHIVVERAISQRHSLPPLYRGGTPNRVYSSVFPLDSHLIKDFIQQ